MAKINLLPWREELRKERQRQFLSILGLVLMLGVVVIFAYKYTVGLQIDSQQRRNDYLRTEIKSLESKIREIERLEAERQKLIERMEMITDLQKSRPRIVRLFDELARSIPEGLNLKSITRNGNKLLIIGSAESAQRITSFMRKVDESNSFTNAHLKDISTDSDYGGGRKAFELTLEESSNEKKSSDGSLEQ